jgi:tetratricopeptide (TPR) repeat protein
MITRKRILIDMLFNSDSDPKNRTIFELSGRLNVLPNDAARLLKALAREGYVSSPPLLVHHPSSRRKVKCYALTEAGKKEARLQYELIRNIAIKVRDSAGNLRKIAIENLPGTLGYDNRTLGTILSLVRRNVLDADILKRLPRPKEEGSGLVRALKELHGQIHAQTVTAGFSLDEISNLENVKDELERDIGIAYYYRGNFKKALSCYRNVASSARASKNFEILTKVYSNIGHIYFDSDNPNQALRNYRTGLRYSKCTTDDMARATALMGISGVYYKRGDYGKTLAYLMKAIMSYRKTGDKRGLADAYGNLGIVYRDCFGNYKKAMDTSEESMRLRREIGDNRGIAMALNERGRLSLDMGTSYGISGRIKLQKGMYQKAIKLLEESNRMSHEMEYKWMLANNYNDLANARMRLGDLELALKNIKIATGISREIGTRDIECYSLIIHAEILGRKKRWKQASILLERAIAVGREIKHLPVICEANLTYGILEKSQGHYTEAKKYLNNALAISCHKRLITLRRIIKKHIFDLKRVSG